MRPFEGIRVIDVTHVLAGPFAGVELTAHEFHYSTVVHEGQAERLFEAVDAAGEVVGPAGLCRGNISGSYMHMIDLVGAL